MKNACHCTARKAMLISKITQKAKCFRLEDFPESSYIVPSEAQRLHFHDFSFFIFAVLGYLFDESVGEFL